MIEHKIEIGKEMLRRSNPDVIKRQLRHIVDRVLAGTRGNVWQMVGNRDLDPVKNGDGAWCYLAEFKLVRKGREVSPDVEQRQIAKMREIAEVAGRASGWLLLDVSVDQNIRSLPLKQEQKFAECVLSNDKKFFSHIYDRDAQIIQLQAALVAGQKSDFRDRFNCLLYGPTACGKTEILRAFKAMLGPESYIEFDATSTTPAGAHKVLTEAAILPRVLFIEEIEKTPEINLRWLLSVCDQRGELRKTNYRVGNISKDVQLLVFATANDIDLFRRLLDGALVSRFPNQVYCPRPDRVVLEQILSREMKTLPASERDVRWIRPALDYALDVEKTDDPRRIIAIMKCGREKLLTGEYQNVLQKTRDPGQRKGT